MTGVQSTFAGSLLAAVMMVAGIARGLSQEAVVPEEAAVARDRALYAGTWKIVAIESDGEA